VNNPSQPPIHALRFDGPEIKRIEEYSPLQTAILPVAGLADGVLEPFATCFGISRSLPIVVTAWHVVSDFIDANRAGLADGTCHLAVIYETDEPEPGTDFHIGGPLPVFEVAFQAGSDLAVMTLWDVESKGRAVAPAAVAPIRFSVPEEGDYCYSFGYPHLKGSALQVEDGHRVVDFERTMHATGGRVIEAFAEGQPGHSKVRGPSMHCNAPAPSGMSGGPVSTDASGICGAISSSIAPFDETDPWSTFITLLHPLLDFEITLESSNGPGRFRLRDLVESGDIDIDGPIPPPPAARPPTTTLQFGRPVLPGIADG
jgi:hypothetical protein